jgi:dihydroorotate dehydrogenase (NAD+) catalytic subunit
MNPLAVQLAGVALDSPLVLASGILGTTASSLRRVAQAGAGAVTAKSCSLEPRKGHPAPCILPWKGGMLNAVGLSNPGAEGACAEFAEYKRTCQTPLIASIFADSPEAFGQLARRIADARPDLIEVNVSCPNVESEFGVPFAADPDALAAVARAVKEQAGAIPIAVKLSVQCASIARMAEICQRNGADAITAINTVGPGMWIDTGAGRPVLSNNVGGVSGTAILPIAVRAVHEIRKAVDLPIIGTGGVSTADDALQLLMAGADAVAIGSALYQGGIELFAQINATLADWLKARGLDSIAQVKGAAHRERRPPPPCGVGESGRETRTIASIIRQPASPTAQGHGGLKPDASGRPPPPCGVGESGRETRTIASIIRQPASPTAQGHGGLKPASPGEIRTLPVESVLVHHDTLKSFTLPQTFDAYPGQFVMLWIPGLDEKPFSISDVRDGLLEITAKTYGAFSRALMDLQPGDLLGVRGPFGRGFRPRGRGLVVGGGIGIAPLRFLAHAMQRDGMEFSLVLGARTANELIFADDFARMGAQFATDDGSFGHKGFALPLVEKLCASQPFDVLYGCGPEPMLVALKATADRFAIDCQLSLERHMKCGIGICGSCCVDGSGICICREGPVLDSAQIDRMTDFGQPHRDATGARKPPKAT